MTSATSLVLVRVALEDAPQAKAPTPPSPPTPPDQPGPPGPPSLPDIHPSPDVFIGVPGGIPFDPNVIAGRVESIAIAFFFSMAFIIVGLPLVRAWARRMDRRGTTSNPALPADLGDRLVRIEQAVESIAIEVERVAEGQRFTTKLLSEQRAPVALPLKDRS